MPNDTWSGKDNGSILSIARKTHGKTGPDSQIFICTDAERDRGVSRQKERGKEDSRINNDDWVIKKPAIDDAMPPNQNSRPPKTEATFSSKPPSAPSHNNPAENRGHSLTSKPLSAPIQSKAAKNRGHSLSPRSRRCCCCGPGQRSCVEGF